MTFAPVHIDGPAEDTRRAYGATLNALRGAVARSADLLRRIDNPDAPAPGLTWTAAETAAHVVGDLRDYTEALTRHAGVFGRTVDVYGCERHQCSQFRYGEVG